MNLHYVLAFLFFIAHTSIGFAAADSLVYSFSFSDTTKYDPFLSADIDMKTEPGKLIIAKGNNKNLSSDAVCNIYFNVLPTIQQTPTSPIILDTARMNPRNLNDNNLFSIIRYVNGNIGAGFKVDLQAIRKISRVQVSIIAGTDGSENVRPRAFTYYAGIDSNRLNKVFSTQDNADKVHTAFLSEVVDAQYVRFVLDKMDPNFETVISEVRIFGEGYLPNGVYVSKIDSIPARGNFGSVHMDAEFDTKTSVTFEMRTGSTKSYDSTKWSEWSKPVRFTSKEGAEQGSLLNVTEPRKYFQYRIKVVTNDLGTPKVNSVKIVYQSTLIADSSYARITPAVIPVLSPVSLTYSLQNTFSSSTLGIDTIIIDTPSPGIVRSVRINGSDIPYVFKPAPNKITIGFPATISSSANVDITFSTKMIQSGTFPSVLISKQSSWNPQTVDPEKTSDGLGWNVYATGVPEQPLIDVRIDPNPFTPNNDGKNDATVIDFSIANVEKEKKLTVAVYSLEGKKIRTIISMLSGINPFFGDPRTGGKGFLWDGKDDRGKTVLPGVYIVQVTFDVDNGGQSISKPVVVAY